VTRTIRAVRAARIAAVLLAVGMIACGSASTAPPAPQRQPAVKGPTLVAAGDIACAPGELVESYQCRQGDTARLVARLRPAAVAPLGDLQYETGSPAQFAGSWARSWGRLRASVHPAIGNHEYGTPGAAGYFGTFGARAGKAGEGWYSYELGSWHVVVLNANCGIVGCGPGSPQERWLRTDLARHRARCTLAYWHQPRFSSGLHGSDPALATFWRDLQRAGAEVVLSGHDHDYERFAPQDASGRADPRRGIVQFVVGTGGKSQYPIFGARPNSRVRGNGFGVLELTLGRGRWAWRFVPGRGERLRDAGTARCHDGHT
jgi:acid phosphatase type 7